METAKIEIVPYSALWAAQFEALKEVYTMCLGDSILAVEHVGSTSVPGLAAKPVLDIDLVVADEEKLQLVIPQLEQLGYIYRGDLGIKDRYAFGMTSTAVPDTGLQTTWPGHHLYCCLSNSVSLKNHLLLRDALRRDTQLRDEYGMIKQALAATVTGMDEYVAGKSDFIAAVLLREGMAAPDVQDIHQQNRKK